jgi:hypothetical protein
MHLPVARLAVPIFRLILYWIILTVAIECSLDVQFGTGAFPVHGLVHRIVGLTAGIGSFRKG